MGNLKEWLSDNLRYVIIGVLAVLILLALVFGIRSTIEKNKAQKEKEAREAMEAEMAEESKPLTISNDTDVNNLIQEYYDALGKKDVEAVEKTVDNLTQGEKTKIENTSYIDGYKNVVTYVKDGMDDNSLVAYVTYDYLCTGITTAVPAMSQLYLAKDEQGSWLIDQAAMEDSDINNYLTLQLKQEDVEELVSKVQQDYIKAQESDEKLAAFLNSLGESQTTGVAVENGTELTIKEGCYMREEPDKDSESICSLEEGESVTKTGSSGEWVQIEYEGETGYVRSDLLK